MRYFLVTATLLCSTLLHAKEDIHGGVRFQQHDGGAATSLLFDYQGLGVSLLQKPHVYADTVYADEYQVGLYYERSSESGDLSMTVRYGINRSTFLYVDDFKDAPREQYWALSLDQELRFKMTSTFKSYVGVGVQATFVDDIDTKEEKPSSYFVYPYFGVIYDLF